MWCVVCCLLAPISGIDSFRPGDDRYLVNRIKRNFIHKCCLLSDRDGKEWQIKLCHHNIYVIEMMCQTFIIERWGVSGDLDRKVLSEN